jgi:hypothetical protein
MVQCKRCKGIMNRGINLGNITRYRCSKCGHVENRPTKPRKSPKKNQQGLGKKIGTRGGHDVFVISSKDGLY